MKFIKKYWIDLLVVVLSFFFLYFFVVVRAPINMDEFSQYHPIICGHYEGNKLNIFREACGMYDLKIPGSDTFLPLRSYGYGGSLSSLLYYPFFLIWQSPYSARAIGFLFVLIQAYFLSKLLRFKFRNVLLGLVLFFPYVYQILIDTGIIQFYTTAIIMVVYFIQRWFITFKNRYIYLVGLFLFLLFFARLSFGFGFPALIVVFIYFGIRHYEHLRSRWKSMLMAAFGAALIMIIPSALYLFSIGNDGTQQIIAELTTKTDSHTFAEMLNPKTYLNSIILRRFLNPFEATERSFVMGNINILGLIYSLVLFGGPIILFIKSFIEKKFLKRVNVRFNFLSMIFYLAFLVTCFMLFRTLSSKHMHHAMMAYPFILLSWGYLIGDIQKLTKKFYIVFFSIFVAINLFYFISFTNQEVQIYDDKSKEVVNEVLNSDYLAENYFYVHPNWGSYFYQALYGPSNQSNLYIESYLSDNTVTERLLMYPDQYNKDLLIIYDKKIPNTVEKIPLIFPKLVECSKTKDSEIWGILMPQDDNPENPCR